MLLGLDTTTESVHLALVDGARSWTRHCRTSPGRTHSHLLLAELDALLDEAGITPQQLTGIACCLGPGGFTALRIGVATAEGLAVSGLPTWGFTAFELRSRALHLAGQNEACWVLLDGQRGEAFAQYWGYGPKGQPTKHALATLEDLVQGREWWAPEAFAPKAQPFLSAPQLRLENEAAATCAALAILTRDIVRRPPEPVLSPFYLRETDAELNFPQASAHLPEALRRGLAR